MQVISEKCQFGGTWLAHSVECVTLDLRVMSSSPTLSVEPMKGRGEREKGKGGGEREREKRE